ncbi:MULTISPECIES: MazG nucleotide pyrophosphohydrolase domain-containing protein [Nesterenkonia]|uniref:MazG nucleotide pyrophosphohydrolase domain-containing protein n=1 Tax=Nesterenkonia TaxID=57494 RepID=UPI0011B67E49|nr:MULTISPECIES: MazG nucleotide pyrophosphohydrolase domain-containing protein [Nesterenkonia]
MQISEIIDALEPISSRYAQSNSIDRTSEWFMLKLQEEVGELTQAFIDLRGMGRDRGTTEKQRRDAFDAEVADVLGQLLLLAHHNDVDVEQAVEEKWLKWA